MTHQILQPSRPTTIRHLAKADPKYGFSVEQVQQSLGPELDDDGFEMPAIPRRKLPSPDLSTLTRFNKPDLRLIEFMNAHERGIVRYGEDVDRARLIEEIWHCFETRFVVVMLHDDEAHKLARTLVERGNRCTCVTNGSYPFPIRVGGIIVATYYGLAHDDVEAEKLRMAIIWDALESLGSKCELPLSALAQARLYGFVHQYAGLPRFDQDRLEAVYGYESLVIPEHGHGLRPVEVVMEPMKQGPKIALDADIVELKREGIWHNQDRNRRIARLAHSMEEGALGRQDDVEGASARLRRSGEQFTGILVENVEHGLVLARMLPGWRMIVGDNVDVAQFAAEDRKLLTPPRWPQSTRKIIITLEGLQCADLRYLNVLIRADGGIGIPGDLPGSLITGNWNYGPLLLVDFHDRFHPTLRIRSKERLEAYLHMNWHLGNN